MDYLSAHPFSAISNSPTVTIQIMKVENGYTLQLSTNPHRPHVAYAPDPNPFEGLDPDEVIDKMVDGAGAVLRRLHDAGAGEDWKEDGDREQVREAVKAMFPGLARQITRAKEPPSEPSRHESLVFESKAKLMEFIEKEL